MKFKNIENMKIVKTFIDEWLSVGNLILILSFLFNIKFWGILLLKIFESFSSLNSL